MAESTDFNEDEYDVMTGQIITILKNIPRLDIPGENGLVRFLTEEFADKVHIFDKIYPYEDDNRPEYVFVLEGLYILERVLPENIKPKKPESWEAGGYQITRTVGAEGTLPEHDEIKKLIGQILNQTYELRGEKGSIFTGDQSDIIITEKINPNKGVPEGHTQYVFILPAYYNPK